MAYPIITSTGPVREDAETVASIIVGLLAIAAIALLFFFYAFPAMQRANEADQARNATINVTIPAPATGGQESSQSTSPNVP